MADHSNNNGKKVIDTLDKDREQLIKEISRLRKTILKEMKKKEELNKTVEQPEKP